MGYQIYKVGHRWGGYGVPATCEHPKCDEEIDRGVSFACGGEPFSEFGCDRYFCDKHLDWRYFNEVKGNWCRHRNDCDCRIVQLCERCMKSKNSFPYKSEHPEWIRHLLTDDSWKEWRKENPKELQELTPHQ
jgi:hypothetical protein|tara:strand:+ start:751 stop:1146 length:396 start_codon:yes stop_codon:yes gene_type:complete